MLKMEAFKDIIVKTMVELLGVFAIMMKEMEQGQTSELITDDTFSVTDRDLEMYGKKFSQALVKKKDRIGTALSRMDKLTDNEVVEAIVQIRSAVKRVEHGVERAIGGNVLQFNEGTFITSVTHKYHLKPTSHTTSRRGKESS